METIDIVDENDNVIGKGERNEVIAGKLRHRLVHVLVFNSEGKMALQLRSKTVKFAPGYWSTTAGGFVRSGESYDEAAKREFQEELGITENITPIHKDDFEDERTIKFFKTYRCDFDGPFNPDPAEVERVEFFTIEKIRAMIDNGEKFHPELLALLEKYYLK